jgi:hypothetical protein
MVLQTVCLARGTPLKTLDFDGLTVISTFRVLDHIVKYLRNAAKKTGLSGRKRRVFRGAPLAKARLSETVSRGSIPTFGSHMLHVPDPMSESREPRATIKFAWRF